MDESATKIVHNGRVVIASVKWWLEHGGMTKSDLYCLHSIQLDENCPECKKETS